MSEWICWLDDNGYGDVDYSFSSDPEGEEEAECRRLRRGDYCPKHSDLTLRKGLDCE